MKLSLGPILYYWPRETVLDFYRTIADAPVDSVYLGETVCSRRHQLRLNDWLDIAAMLSDAGKQVILSTQVLIESESDLKTLRQITDNSRFMIEANDMGAVHLLAGKQPFVAGPHLNLFNHRSLDLLISLGAQRWVLPPEMSAEQLAHIRVRQSAAIETEAFVWGRLPLAFSARCFTARAHKLAKDDCQFRCLDYPEGLSLHTREDQEFLILNGIQTQSALTCNLIGELDSLHQHQVDVLRISPQPTHTLEVIARFHAALNTRTEADHANMSAFAPSGLCNGYWHAEAGMSQQAHFTP